MNTITIELCAEDRARLDNILDALKGGAACHCIPSPVAPAVTAEIPAEAPEPPQEKPKAADPNRLTGEAPKAPEEPKKDAPEVTAAELQSKVVQLVSAGKKAETRAIVLEYAKSVSEIPAEKRAEVLARLAVLEG